MVDRNDNTRGDHVEVQNGNQNLRIIGLVPIMLLAFIPTVILIGSLDRYLAVGNFNNHYRPGLSIKDIESLFGKPSLTYKSADIEKFHKDQMFYYHRGNPTNKEYDETEADLIYVYQSRGLFEEYRTFIFINTKGYSEWFYSGNFD